MKRQFQKFYWGRNGARGNVWRERWLVPRRRLERWAQRAELALFTGRTRRELRHTLDHFGVAHLFRARSPWTTSSGSSPIPRACTFCSAKSRRATPCISATFSTTRWPRASAGVPFVGVLARGSEAHRVRAGQLREHGARLILHDANELERHWK